MSRQTDVVPLRRNRDFNLLWTSQALSELGSAMSALAVPLLVLALTGSPILAGVVATIASVARLTARLPAGVLADRISRRRSMLACDGTRVVAYAVLATAVFTGHASLPLIVAVVVVDAICGVMFDTAERSALPNLVPATQLSAAVARNEARTYGTGLVGPPLGGLLFGLGRALPFVADAVTYLVSFVGVALVRRPMQRPSDEPHASPMAAVAEGVRFVFGNPFLRSVVMIAAPLNFGINGVIFTMILALQREGTAPAVIGLASTLIGVGGLLGAILAPALQRRLRMFTLIVMICWSAALLLATGALFVTTVAGAVPFGLAVFLGPAANAALFGYLGATTPDRLQGRVLSIIFMAASSAAALAPLLAGVLIGPWGAVATALVFASAVGISALAVTFGQGIRTAPPLTDVAAESGIESESPAK